MRPALKLPKRQKSTRPLDRVNRPENARQRFPVPRIFLQNDQLTVEPVEIFTALQQEFANNLVAHSLFLNLFRFGTRRSLLRPQSTALPFFFLCAHTIPSANAPAPTFTVHPAFQHDSFHQPSVPASSNSLPPPLSPHPFSFLQSSLVSAYLPPPPPQPFLQPLFLSLFNSAAPLHSGTPPFHFSNYNFLISSSLRRFPPYFPATAPRLPKTPPPATPFVTKNEREGKRRTTRFPSTIFLFLTWATAPVLAPAPLCGSRHPHILSARVVPQISPPPNTGA